MLNKSLVFQKQQQLYVTKNGIRLLDEQNLETIIKLGLECTRQNKMILKQHAIINQLNCCITPSKIKRRPKEDKKHTLQLSGL